MHQRIVMLTMITPTVYKPCDPHGITIDLYFLVFLSTVSMAQY